MKRCLNFTAYERAEQKKSQKLVFRAAAQSGTSSFRMFCLIFALIRLRPALKPLPTSRR
jgi:hypothetical protein